MTSYKVADGFSVTTKRGTIKAGKKVFANDFSHGDDALKDLVAKGHVVEDSKQKAVTKK